MFQRFDDLDVGGCDLLREKLKHADDLRVDGDGKGHGRHKTGFFRKGFTAEFTAAAQIFYPNLASFGHHATRQIVKQAKAHAFGGIAQIRKLRGRFDMPDTGGL